MPKGGRSPKLFVVFRSYRFRFRRDLVEFFLFGRGGRGCCFSVEGRGSRCSCVIGALEMD